MDTPKNIETLKTLRLLSFPYELEQRLIEVLAGRNSISANEALRCHGLGKIRLRALQGAGIVNTTASPTAIHQKIGEGLLAAVLEQDTASAARQFAKVSSEVNDIVRRRDKMLDEFTQQMRKLLNHAEAQSAQWSATLDDYLQAARAMEQRYQAFGKKGSHADIIRQTLQRNIAARDWSAAEHNIDALIQMYNFDDTKKT